MTDDAQASPVNDQTVHLGQAVYGRRFLAAYDLWVLGLSCRLVWRCPKARMRAAYNRNVGARHLELGVGTGYFLDRGTFTDPSPAITLLDLNPGVLDLARDRLARYQPTTVCANVLRPLPLPARSFDSVALNFLLHCLPGTWKDKSRTIAAAALAARAGGRVFGSTILSSGIRVSPRARRLIEVYNQRGIFHNAADDLDGLRAHLEQHLTDLDLTVVGCVALFEGAPRT